VGRGATVDTSSFVDGIGRRVRITDPDGEALESLRLCRELSEAASTEAALIERAGRLATFSSPSFGRVRRIERLPGAFGAFAVVSEAVPGVRLSELLRRAQRGWVDPDPEAALSVLQHVVDAVAELHRHSRDVAHGAIGPERVVVKPDGRAVVVDYVLGPAIEELRMGRGRLWLEFRVPVPAVAGTVRFDQFTDVMQLGVLALALVLGRPIRRDEFPQSLPALLGELSGQNLLAVKGALPRAIQSWIVRSVSLEPRSSFRNAIEAAAALESAIQEDRRLMPSLGAVVRYLEACPSDSDATARTDPAVHADAHAPEVEAQPVLRADHWPGSDPAMTMRLSAPRAMDPEPASTQVLVTIAPPARPRATSPGADEAATPPSGSWLPTARDWGSQAIGRLATALDACASWAGEVNWTVARRAFRLTAVVVGLAALFGVTYLGARSYLGFPGLIPRTGTLILESRPAGAEVLVDGRPHGVTPATLELSEGEHTVALRLQKRTTLVPIVIVAGDRTIQRVDLRRRPAPRPTSPSLSPSRIPR
jgi:hypothetical protein